MWSGGAARFAHRCDHLPPADLLASCHAQVTVMRVEGGEPVGVFDNCDQPITLLLAGVEDCAGLGRFDWRSRRRSEVNAIVRLLTPPPEAGIQNTAKRPLQVSLDVGITRRPLSSLRDTRQSSGEALPVGIRNLGQLRLLGDNQLLPGSERTPVADAVAIGQGLHS